MYQILLLIIMLVPQLVEWIFEHLKLPLRIKVHYHMDIFLKLYGDVNEDFLSLACKGMVFFKETCKGM